MKVVTKHINPNKEIKEGVLVRWPEYPDRLYFCSSDWNQPLWEE